jgi:acetoin utilization protein AcuB
MLKNRTVKVEEYTTPSPVMVEQTRSLAEVAEIMDHHQFRHIPVVDGQGVPVGIITDRDLKVVAGFDSMKSMTAKELMTPDPYIVSSETPLDEVVMAMSRTKIGSAIVRYDDDQTLGLFTSTDALNALIEIVRGEA